MSSVSEPAGGESVGVRAANRFRLEYRPTVPASYSGTQHFASINAVCLLVVAVCLFILRRASEDGGWFAFFSDRTFWVVFACTFFFANGIEYYLHKNVLHGVGVTRHSGLHHRFFTDQRMSLDDFKADPYAILFPQRAAPAFFGIVMPVVSLVLGFAAGNWRVGVYFELTGAYYYLTYEWLHLMYHLDDQSWVRYIPFFSLLRRHHLIHHHQPYMRACNFNITYPIFDAICGTLVTELPPHTSINDDRVR